MKVLFTALLLVIVLGFPLRTYAQSAPTPAPATTTQPMLPNDIENSAAPNQASTSTSSKPLTQQEQFIAGVGVGVVFGIIVGGLIIWFTKKT